MSERQPERSFKIGPGTYILDSSGPTPNAEGMEAAADDIRAIELFEALWGDNTQALQKDKTLQI